MSPVSRVRKRVSEPEPQSVNGLFKDILKYFASVGTQPDPLEVELLTSEVTEQWWDFPLEEDESPLGLELIGFASRKITPGAAALLAALKVLGETEEEREEAASALETVLSRGIPAPTGPTRSARSRSASASRAVTSTATRPRCCAPSATARPSTACSRCWTSQTVAACATSSWSTRPTRCLPTCASRRPRTATWFRSSTSSRRGRISCSQTVSRPRTRSKSPTSARTSPGSARSRWRGCVPSPSPPSRPTCRS